METRGGDKRFRKHLFSSASPTGTAAQGGGRSAGTRVNKATLVTDTGSHRERDFVAPGGHGRGVSARRGERRAALPEPGQAGAEPAAPARPRCWRMGGAARLRRGAVASSLRDALGAEVEAAAVAGGGLLPCGGGAGTLRATPCRPRSPSAGGGRTPRRRRRTSRSPRRSGGSGAGGEAGWGRRSRGVPSRPALRRSGPGPGPPGSALVRQCRVRSCRVVVRSGSVAE